MRRRDFIRFVGGTAALWPLAARGQVTRKRPLIGRLSFGSRDDPTIVRYIDAFLSGMRELGYNEGRDFDMTYGMADFHRDRLPQVAAELVERAPDVIEAGATIEAVAAAKATTTIPIVVGVLADPVALGFTTSDARPTGNVTGIMPYVTGLPSKQLELARELVPGATRIGLIDDVVDPKAHRSRFLARSLKRMAREGSIVSTASIAGLIPGSGPAYNVAKYGVVALSEGLRATLAPRGIGVSVLCPGFVRTQIMNSRRNVPQRFASALEARPTEGPIAEFIKVFSERVSKGIDPLYVGELVREGIENDWPYVFTDTEFEPLIDDRFAAIKQGFDRIRGRQPRH